MLLYGQLQEGLLYTLMESPSVSGAQNYKELCLAAKREERRLAELKKKQQYLKAERPLTGSSSNRPMVTSWNWRRTYHRSISYGSEGNKSEKTRTQQQRQLRCYICDSPNHLARQCQQVKAESSGKKATQTKASTSSGTRVIRTGSHICTTKSGSRCVEVLIEGVPITGLIDTGSDITIIRGDLFYQIIAEAHLKVQSLKTAEQKACTYDQKPITLDGQMDMKISFGEKAISTTVYVKLVAPDQLLLSETVCCLLGIVSYHPSVQSVEKCSHVEETVSGVNVSSAVAVETENSLNCESSEEGKRTLEEKGKFCEVQAVVTQLDSEQCSTSSEDVPPLESNMQPSGEEQPLPSSPGSSAQVRLICTVRLPAYHSAVVPVQVEEIRGSALIEPECSLNDCLQVDESLVRVNEDGLTTLLIINNGKSSCQLKSGVKLAQAHEANIELISNVNQMQEVTPSLREITAEMQSPSMLEEISEQVSPLHVDSNIRQEVPQVQSEQFKLWTVSSLPNDNIYSNECREWRQQQLREAFIESRKQLCEKESAQLRKLLAEYHDIFSLNDDERGETDLVEFKIDTGDASPKKQAVRRIPFAARQEIVEQLEKMQRNGVIKPSESPWASPVVLVRKRDGSLRFCVDYRALNLVTKPDLFPLPRINDLLDQLGKSKYFSTLDLKSGYWQIKVNADSQEKTAFITHKGLFEFRVMPFGVTNAPAVFQRLMQRVLAGLQSESATEFVSVYLDDVIVFSESLVDHIKHLKAVFDRMRKAGLMLNPKKCKILCDEVEYLGHVVTPCGLKPNNRNLDAIKNFPPPATLKQLQQFLGLTSYYRRFVPSYAKIAHPLHALTRKGALFQWSAECEIAFDTLRAKLLTVPVLAYPDFNKDFTLETDASKFGLGAILSQYQEDQKLHPVAYASRSVSATEANYAITDLETLAVVWAVTHFRYYLYGHKVTIITDHAAVKAILGAPNLTGKHARWWTKVYGSGIKQIDIIHRSGKNNLHVDCLSRQPVMPAPPEEDINVEVQIGMISCENNTIDALLQKEPEDTRNKSDDRFSDEQFKDQELKPIILYLKEGMLPDDDKLAKKTVAEATLYTIFNDILYYIGPTQTETSRVVVPQQLRQKVMQDYHDGHLAGHFSGPRLYKTLVRRWWWPHMYTDAMNYAKNCPQCAIVEGTGRRQRPLLQPIITERPFQIVGVDIMELPVTAKGNKYVIVFQDLFTKWPMVFPTPDQKTERIARLLVEEIIPCFGVPEAVLSDRGTNLLSFLMKDICRMLGIEKLNTTANHPQCNGAIERFNRTLKSMLRKHAAKFGVQWDKYLSGVLWAYRNTPHSSTGEKPSFLLFGFDCRSPTEAALLPSRPLKATNLTDYREEMMLSLSSARSLAKGINKEAQRRYKLQYDKTATTSKFRVGDWVLVYFSQDETGKTRKLSQPWHGPYRIISRDDPDLTVTKIYFPDDPSIQIHQSRVQPCPPSLPTGFYWYGSKRSKPGRPPKQVLKHFPNVTTEDARDELIPTRR